MDETSTIDIGIWVVLGYTYLGALIGHILSLYNQEFQGTVPFMKKIFPNASNTFHFRLDFFILPIIGSFLAYTLLDPKIPQTAIFAGLSWSGTLIALLKRSEQRQVERADRVVNRE